MSEANLNPANARIIFLFLIFFPFIFLILLYVLSITEISTAGGSAIITPILIPALYVIGIIELLFVQFVILPKATGVELEKKFGIFLATFTVGESVSIYGLLIGLIQLFAENITINWVVVTPFTAISVLYLLFVYSGHITPWIEEMSVSQPIV